MRVLDLGGTPQAWEAAPVTPASVVTVNLVSFESRNKAVTHLVADACDLPHRLGRFDLVFSNSLMEHVGGHVQRQRFAATAGERAPRHWIQTPYRYFPVEPHWFFPGMQFLPHPGRIWVSQHWHRGHIKTATPQAALDKVNEIELLSVSQLRGYFADSEIWHERLFGLTKSLVALRS